MKVSYEQASGTILMAAYQCGPGMGSVSQIGWEWFIRTAKRRAVTLLTHVRNRAAIEAAGPLPPQACIEWIDTEWFAGPLHGLASRIFPNSEHAVFATSSIDFFLFDHLALRRARALCRAGARWSVVHVVTPVTTSAATRLHRLGLPLVRGPLNCGLESPAGFAEHLRADSSWISGIRRITRRIDRALGSSRGATRLVAATQATLSEIGPRHAARTVVMAENAIDPGAFTAVAWPAGAAKHLRLLFVGRLIAVKGLDLLLQALAQARAHDLSFSLEILGDGPMRAAWERLAADLGLADRVSFRGAATRAQVIDAMHACHMLVLPSVRESGGSVLVEAMACARPVVAVAWGGPAEIVHDQVGRALPADNPQGVIAGLLQAVVDCVQQPDAWERRGEAAAAEARRLWSWDARLAGMDALYRDAQQAHATRT